VSFYRPVRPEKVEFGRELAKKLENPETSEQTIREALGNAKQPFSELKSFLDVINKHGCDSLETAMWLQDQAEDQIKKNGKRRKCSN